MSCSTSSNTFSLSSAGTLAANALATVVAAFCPRDSSGRGGAGERALPVVCAAGR